MSLFDDDTFQALDADDAPGDGDASSRPLDSAVEWGVRSNHRAMQRQPPGASTDPTSRWEPQEAPVGEDAGDVASANWAVWWSSSYLIHGDLDKLVVEVPIFHRARDADTGSGERETPGHRQAAMRVRLRLASVETDPVDTWDPVPYASAEDVRWHQFELQVPDDAVRDYVEWAQLEIEWRSGVWAATEVVINSSSGVDPDVGEDATYQYGATQSFPNTPAQAMFSKPSSTYWEIMGTMQEYDDTAGDDQIWLVEGLPGHLGSMSSSQLDDVDIWLRYLTWMEPLGVEIREVHSDTDDISDGDIQAADPVDAADSSAQHARESSEIDGDERPMLIADLGGEDNDATEGAPMDLDWWVEDGQADDVVFDDTCRLPFFPADQVRLRWAWSWWLAAPLADVSDPAGSAGRLQLDLSAEVYQMPSGATDWTDAVTIGDVTDQTFTPSLYPTVYDGSHPLALTAYRQGFQEPIAEYLYREGLYYDRDRGFLEIESMSIAIDSTSYNENLPVGIRMTVDTFFTIFAEPDVEFPDDGTDYVTEGRTLGCFHDMSVWR